MSRRLKKIPNYNEKDEETPKFSKKRKRVTIKRGINCAWSSEDVYIL
jgi:hypothetical protein